MQERHYIKFAPCFYNMHMKNDYTSWAQKMLLDGTIMGIQVGAIHVNIEETTKPTRERVGEWGKNHMEFMQFERLICEACVDIVYLELIDSSL